MYRNSRADYIEIVKYTAAHQIEVIQEIDVPGHARAAVVSMEARYARLNDPTDTSNTTTVQFYDRRSSLKPCLDSSLHYVDKVMSEIVQMHKEAGQPLKDWHFGGDEVKNIRFGANGKRLSRITTLMQ